MKKCKCYSPVVGWTQLTYAAGKLFTVWTTSKLYLDLKKKSQPISSIHASPKPCTKSVVCSAQRTAWPEWLPCYKAIHSALTSHVRCWVIVSPAYEPPLFKCCCCSVTQVCLTLCNPVDCSTSGFPVLHHLLELAQTHVHRVEDAIQPSHPLSSPSPALNFSQHQGLF